MDLFSTCFCDEVFIKLNFKIVFMFCRIHKKCGSKILLEERILYYWFFESFVQCDLIIFTHSRSSVSSSELCVPFPLNISRSNYDPQNIFLDALDQLIKIFTWPYIHSYSKLTPAFSVSKNYQSLHNYE